MANPHVEALETQACLAAAEYELPRLWRRMVDQDVPPWVETQAEELAQLVTATRRRLAVEVKDLRWLTVHSISDAEAIATREILPKSE